MPYNFRLNKSLGSWVKEQKKCFKDIAKGKSSDFTRVHIELLEIIGFQWNSYKSSRMNEEHTRHLDMQGFEWDELSDVECDASAATLTNNSTPHNNNKSTKQEVRLEWQQYYDKLLEFHKRHGHCNVPSKYEEDKKLGRWVQTQRYKYKDMDRWKAAHLTDKHIELLEEIGFQWEFVRLSSSLTRKTWDDCFNDLVEFKQQFGHCKVPRLYDINYPLWRWLNIQRDMHKSSRMSKARTRRLEELGFEWDVLNDGMEQDCVECDERATSSNDCSSTNSNDNNCSSMDGRGCLV